MIEGQQHVVDRRAVGHVGSRIRIWCGGPPSSHETGGLSTPGGNGAVASRKTLYFRAKASSGSPKETPQFREKKARSDSTRNSGSSLLKSLNSLYRPAVPEGIRGRLVPPFSERAIGASPSGKAVDFDSTMRRFESSRPSQPLAQPEGVGAHPSKLPHFIGFLCVCPKSPAPQKWQPWREFAESLQPKPQKFPFSWRRLAETGSITTGRWGWQ